MAIQSIGKVVASELTTPKRDVKNNVALNETSLRIKVRSDYQVLDEREELGASQGTVIKHGHRLAGKTHMQNVVARGEG